jgi:hypothetical protein
MRRGSKKKAMLKLDPYLVSGPIEGGDYDARCPLHEDRKRSMRVNFEKWQWICFAGCGSGSLTGLLRRMDAEDSDNGEGRDSSPKPKRTKGRPSGSKVVTAEDVEGWHQELLGNLPLREFLWAKRDVRDGSILRFKLGWDRASQAFTIPIYLADGSLYNVRKYRPNAPADKKIWWAVPKDPSTIVPMFPEDVIEDSSAVVLAEGEMDAIVANQYGFPTVTGTAGAGSWSVSWSERFRGKQVFICFDRDRTGERSARQVAQHLEPFASKVYIVKLPYRFVEKGGKDISDFFLDGKDEDDFKKVLRSALPQDRKTFDPTDTEASRVSVMDSFDSSNVGRPMEMDVLVSGRTRDPFSIPKLVTSSCTMDAGPKCKFCPMLSKGGEYTHEVPPWSPAVLQMVGHSSREQGEALRKVIAAMKCDRLRHDVQSFQTVETLFVRPSWDEDNSDFTPRRIYSVGRHNTMPSQVVNVRGTTWPDPDQQRNQFLAWEVADAESAIDEFKLTPEVIRDLQVFQPDEGQTPLSKLREVAEDYTEHVTRIYGRRDLHVAIMLVYHSVLSFPLLGKVEPRGWLDALIIGDTRTGKSEAARRIANHYRLGKVINCEAASFAGIIGGLQQIGAGKEWSVTWGAVPMNDRRLVVLDEASGLSFDDIQSMSDARSSGYVLLQKIQSEQAWARTRLLWLSNPRSESMEAYTYGVQAIPPLIGNREDVARFDFAMALTSGDVSLAKIQRLPSGGEPEFDADLAHALVLWSWSRSPEDVEWVGEAENDVLRASTWLSERYVADPPLLQSANARYKVARIAVAIAAATFSTDSAGRKLLVTRAHVADALRFLHGTYRKDIFGYYRMSTRRTTQRARAIERADEAKRWLEENPNVSALLRRVEGGQFRRDMLEQIANMDRPEANAAINKLFDFGLVYPNGQYVKMEPMLHQLIREIDEEEVR